MATILENISMLNEQFVSSISNTTAFDHAFSFGETITNTFNDFIYSNVFNDYKPFTIPAMHTNDVIPIITTTNLLSMLSKILSYLLALTVNTMILTFAAIDTVVTEIINNQSVLTNIFGLLFIGIVLINYEEQNIKISNLQKTISKMEVSNKKHASFHTTTYANTLDRLTNLETLIEEQRGYQKAQKSCINAMDRKMRKMQKDLYNEYA